MKTNNDGRPCPDWCAIDHHQDAVQSCNGAADLIESDPPACFAAWPRLGYCADAPSVAANAWSGERSGALELTSRQDAEQLASFLDVTASVPAETIREVAGQIRQAADLAWPEPAAEAEPEAGS
jgi:hypothetical protein